MAVQKASNPLNIEILDVILFKYQKTQQISLMAQFFELTLYQSLFAPVMKAELTVFDPIGLFWNFPLIGEETIEVSYRPTRGNPGGVQSGDDVPGQNVVNTLRFMVNSVKGIMPHMTVNSQLFVLELYPVEMKLNAKKRLQMAYHDSYHNVIRRVLREELEADPNKFPTGSSLWEEASGVHHFIVPNMKPYEAILWMNKRAVPREGRNNLFCFFETIDGYNFRTVEGMFAQTKTIPKYIWLSNVNDAMRRTILRQEGLSDAQIISGIEISTRWNTLEKTLGGYFENEYFDIDIFNKKVHSTKTELREQDQAQSRFNMNTPRYIQDMKTTSDKDGSKTRVRYTISQNEGDQDDDQHMWKTKFGDVAKLQTALSQVSVTISLPGDTRVNVGDLIEIDLPEIHGFTRQERERYLQGKWVIVDCKHVVAGGQVHTMVLNIHKESYANEILANMTYGQGLTTGPGGRVVGGV